MKVRDYVARLSPSDQITFIKARARKDAHTPGYHAEYQTTPLQRVVDWGDKIMDYIILNDKQPAITWLSGVDWNPQIRKGWAKCLLVIHPEDFALLYPCENQRKAMEYYIERKLEGGDLT